MTQPASTEARRGGASVVLGIFMLLLAAFTAFLAYATVTQPMGVEDGPAKAAVAQLGLTALWLGWAGLLLLRRAPWARFRMAAIVAILAGVIGVVTYAPMSVGNGWAQAALDKQYAPRSFLLWGLSAVLAGLGHLRGARSPAGWLHALAAAGIVGGTLYAATHH